jgi:hypothetical protein
MWERRPRLESMAAAGAHLVVELPDGDCHTPAGVEIRSAPASVTLIVWEAAIVGVDLLEPLRNRRLLGDRTLVTRRTLRPTTAMLVDRVQAWGTI